MGLKDQGDLAIAHVFVRWRTFSFVQQSGGRVPGVWRDAIEADPQLLDVVMVVELVFGGPAGRAVVRLATVPVTSKSARDGTDHSAVPLLVQEPDITNEYTLAEGTSSARALLFTLDPKTVNPAKLIRDGLILAGIGEVVLELPGGDYDDRYVLLRGDMSGGVSFGAVRDQDSGLTTDQEIMEVEIVDPRDTINTKIPPWVLTVERITTLHSTGEGERYPIATNGYDKMPCVRTTSGATGANDFCFAQGSGWDVTVVFVDGLAVNFAAGTFAATIEVRTDNFGVEYSVIAFTTAGTSWPDTVVVHATFARADGTRKTIVGSIRQVIEENSSIGIDGANAQLFADAEARLPSVSSVQPNIIVNGSGGGSAATVLDWVEQGVLQSFPMISMVWEGGGYGPVFTDFRLDPIAHFVIGQAPLVDRATLVQERPKRLLFNEFVLRYAYDSITDVYTKTAIRDPSTSDICELSRQYIGERHAEVIESKYIQDDATASWVQEWRVAHESMPSYLVEYPAHARVLFEHRRGDTVEVTDSDFDWVREAATIEKMVYRRGQVMVSLRVWLRFADLGGVSQSFSPRR